MIINSKKYNYVDVGCLPLLYSCPPQRAPELKKNLISIFSIRIIFIEHYYYSSFTFSSLNNLFLIISETINHQFLQQNIIFLLFFLFPNCFQAIASFQKGSNEKKKIEGNSCKKSISGDFAKSVPQYCHKIKRTGPIIIITIIIDTIQTFPGKISFHIFSR